MITVIRLKCIHLDNLYLNVVEIQLNKYINVVFRLHSPPQTKSGNDMDLSVWVRGGFAKSSRGALTRRSLLEQLDQVVKCESIIFPPLTMCLKFFFQLTLVISQSHFDLLTAKAVSCSTSLAKAKDI